MQGFVLRGGSRGEDVRSLQRALNEQLGLRLDADGIMGRISLSALESYQAKVGIVESDPQGVYYGPKTQAMLEPYIEKRFIQVDDMRQAAKDLGCELAAIRAVTTVEAKEFGFFKNGFPVILFERHKFYKYLSQRRGAVTAEKTAALRGDICNPMAGGYKGGEAEIARLDAAIELDEIAAFLSVSWGLFQLMGFNFQLCGYENVQSMVAQMKASEDYQLAAFVKFVRNQPALLNDLRAKNWAGFAEKYNGTNYKINSYDTRLAAAYRLYVGQK